MKPSLVIVGLGNPGKSYEHTRHNLGFSAIDVLQQAYEGGEWKERGKYNALTSEGRIVTFPVLLVKPLTFMNDSGTCIRQLVDFFKLDASKQLLVICDDIDLPLGEVRVRAKGGPGTHNGLRSIVDAIGENFSRMRIGLGDHPTGEELATWVLSRIPPEQQDILQKAMESIPPLIKDYVLETNSD